MATPIPENRAKFRLEEIAAAVGGRLVGRVATGTMAETRVRGVTTDSRRVGPENLFVALRGESFDAHRFVPDLAGRAGAVLVSDESVLPGGLPAVVVADTLRALGDLAAYHRRRWGGRVVALTGSAGKTTTKELMRAALAATGLRVHATKGNLNNFIGLPLTLFGLSSEHDLAVVEAGTNAPGEIARLGEIAQPDVALVTMVARAHTEGLGTLEAVATEKKSLYGALREGGVAVVNADDRHLRELLVAGAEMVRFGAGSESDVQLLGWRIDRRRTRVRIGLGDDSIDLALRMLGEPAARNATAALAVVHALGLDVAAAAAGLVQTRSVPGRLFLDEIGDELVLDDTYNASPRAGLAAIATGAELAATEERRLVCVLGDMRELGEESEAAHEELVAFARERSLAILAVGEAMSAAASSSREVSLEDGMGRVMAAELPADRPTSVEAFGGDFDPEVVARAAVAAADGEPTVFLVKGSRSLRLERIVEALRAQLGPPPRREITREVEA